MDRSIGYGQKAMKTLGGGQDTESQNHGIMESWNHGRTGNMQFLVWPVHRTFARQSCNGKLSVRCYTGCIREACH